MNTEALKKLHLMGRFTKNERNTAMFIHGYYFTLHRDNSQFASYTVFLITAK
jgi:hypothetical protein